MGDSSRCAQLVVTELLGAGVQEVVLSPGSRSAPLAYELFEADKIGLLRLHVRIDERTAGFLALGLAKASERPVAVVTTSGTAAANLHPAVLEAFHSHIPLVAMTADRPRAARHAGGNQTTDQAGSVRPARARRDPDRRHPVDPAVLALRAGPGADGGDRRPQRDPGSRPRQPVVQRAAGARGGVGADPARAAGDPARRPARPGRSCRPARRPWWWPGR